MSTMAISPAAFATHPHLSSQAQAVTQAQVASVTAQQQQAAAVAAVEAAAARERERQRQAQAAKAKQQQQSQQKQAGKAEPRRVRFSVGTKYQVRPSCVLLSAGRTAAERRSSTLHRCARSLEKERTASCARPSTSPPVHDVRSRRSSPLTTPVRGCLVALSHG